MAIPIRRMCRLSPKCFPTYRNSVPKRYRSSPAPEAQKCPMSHGNTSSGQKGKTPPGPRSLPLIGTIYKYLPVIGSYSIRDQQLSDTRRYEEFGPVVREEVFPGQVMYYVYDPDLFASVFQQLPKCPVRFSMEGVGEYRKMKGHHPGFCASEGEVWFKIRQATNKLTLRPHAVSIYTQPQDTVTQDMVNLVKLNRDSKGEVHNLVDIFYRWGMECIGLVIFDTRLGTLSPDLTPGSEAHQFVEAANAAFDTMYDTTFFWPLHKNKKTKTWKRLCDSFDLIYSLSERYIEECLERSKVEEDDLNFLQSLLNKANLQPKEVLAIVCDMFYAGVDTVAHSVGFLLYHLAKNPHKQDILYNEITQHAPLGEEITAQTLEDMKYLRAAFKETLRVTPISAFGVARTFDQDLEVGGYHIPAGNTVFIQPNVVAQREEYFEDPQEFRPERWLRSEMSDRIHAFPMISFGYGARMCAGKRFAEQEIYLGVINLLRHFHIEYHYEDIGMETRFVNQPNKPLRLSLVNR